MRTIRFRNGMIVRVGMIPTKPDRLLGATSVHDRARYQARRTKGAPANCANSKGIDWFDPDANAPDCPQDPYTGPLYGDCVAAGAGNAFTVESARAGMPLIRILAKDVVAWYLQQTNGEDSGLNIDDALTALVTTPMIDSTGTPRTIKGHSGVQWTDQATVCNSLSEYGVLACGVDSSGYEEAIGNLAPGQPFVVSGITQQLQSFDHDIDFWDYGEAAFLADLYKFTPDWNKIGKTTFSVGGETWGSKCIAEFESWCHTIGESWAVEGSFTPAPVPPPVVPPVVPPSPLPDPCSISASAIVEALASFGGIAGVDQARLQKACDALLATPKLSPHIIQMALTLQRQWDYVRLTEGRK